jgi:hypothetical protein
MHGIFRRFHIVDNSSTTKQEVRAESFRVSGSLRGETFESECMRVRQVSASFEPSACGRDCEIVEGFILRKLLD